MIIYLSKIDDRKLAIVDNINNCINGLHFYGSEEDFIQVGTFRYLKDKILRSHRHIKRVRSIPKTEEIVIVFNGEVKVTIYDHDNSEVGSEILTSGSFCIVYHGGVGYKVLSETADMLEVKLGDYSVKDDSEDRELI